MARTDNLTNFLTDVAESIRTKEDTTEQIPASEFDTRIANLSGGENTPEKGIAINDWTTVTYTSTGTTATYATDVTVIGMTEIRDGAFANVGSESGSILSLYLKNITMPDDIVKIGEKAFYYCSKLTLSTLPNSVTQIGVSAFENCNQLAITSLPEGLTYIGKRAFSNCSNIVLTSLPESITALYDFTFSGCEKIKLSSLPEGITSVGSHVFENCDGITSFIWPETITKLDDNTFYRCENLASIELPSTLTSIGSSAFYECKELVLTELPSGLTTIEDNAFFKCEKVALTELPSGITEICMSILSGCTNVSTLTCLGDITKINSYAFKNTNLSKLVLPNITSVPSLYSSVFDNTPIANGAGYIYVPDSLVDSVKEEWYNYEDQIKGISELPTE